MKHLTIPIIFIAASALLMPACDKAPTTSQPDDSVKALETELSRELATALLNKHLAEPHISKIAFKEGGLDKAKQDGLLSEQKSFPGWARVFRFTDKGIAMAHGLANANSEVGLGGPEGVEPMITLISPVGERVAELTGIALSSDPNIRVAEYVTHYLIPDAAQTMYPYIYSGEKAKATFQKFDDGWRVAQ
jgi:hypothetical protein